MRHGETVCRTGMVLSVWAERSLDTGGKGEAQCVDGRHPQ